MGPWDVVAIVLVADFITGLVHWWEDTYGLPSWPLLGRLVVEPNIQHHADPRSILTGTYITRNGHSILSALPIVAVLAWCGFAVVALGLLLATVAGNEIHAWNHGLPMPRWARLLQDMGLLQSRRQHNQHHVRPWTKSYCTMTNVLNPLLDLGFWRAAEWMIPVPVRRTSPERRGF